MKKSTRSLLLALVASAVLIPAAASHESIGAREASQVRRAGLPGLLTDSSSTSAAATSSSETTTPAPPTTTQAQSTTTTATSQITSANPPTSASPTAGSSSTSAAPSPTSSHGGNQSSEQASQSAPVVTSAVPTLATNSAGQVITSYLEITTAASSAAPSQTSSSDGSSNSGLGTGSIIGLSVAGGIAAIAIILFFVWKFTRKRFTDFDDNEAIKWPELNSHNNAAHALPTHDTGRAGFGPENDSDVNLTRAPSPGGTYANSIAASSVPEMYGTGDPYAVPPLPHLNPNQPYRDEPGAYGQSGGFYDPYRGPAPNAFGDSIDGHGTEAIPMTQMARMRSPAPQAAYDMQGRVSPAPQAAMGGYASGDGRSGTPTPGALGTGSGSYGYGSR